jgi:site-specific DNA-methyltransferase (adenine-specific)
MTTDRPTPAAQRAILDALDGHARHTAEQIDRVHVCDWCVLMEHLPEHSVDAVITDPPYGMTQLDFDSAVIDWSTWWQEAARILKHDHSPVIMFSQQPFTTTLINSKPDWFRYEIIWEKTMPVGYLDANRRPLRTHENILIFGAQLPEFYPQFEISTVRRAGVLYRGVAKNEHYNQHRTEIYQDTGRRFPTSVWKFAQRHSAFGETHTNSPTEKPVALLERLVLTFTQPGEIVLDPFCGSGSCAIAARQTRRHFIAADIDPEQVAVTRQRIPDAITLPMFETLRDPQADGDAAGVEQLELFAGVAR